MKEEFLQTLLAAILESASSCHTSDYLNNITILAECLLSAVGTCDSLREKLMSSLNAGTIQNQVWDLIQADPIVQRASCHSHAASLHHKLRSATIGTILTVAITSDFKKPAIAQNMLIALVRRQQHDFLVTHDCSQPSKTNHNVPSLFEQQCTPYTGQHLQDWKKQLASELESQESYKRDSLIRSVALICQDLELRCNTVEEPLRKEQDKCRALEDEVVQLKGQIQSLESHAADDKFHLDGLEDEKLMLAEEKSEVTARLEELKGDFQEATRRADEALNTAREQLRSREAELNSIIVGHEEKARDSEIELSDIREALSQSKANEVRQHEDMMKLDELRDQLELRLSESENQRAHGHQMTSRQAEEMARLTEHKAELERRIQSQAEEYEAVSRRMSDLQASHREFVHASEESARNLEMRHNEKFEAARDKAKEEIEEANLQCQNARDDCDFIEKAHEQTRQQLEELQSSFLSLENQVEDLAERCAEQNDELIELRAWKKKVFASMGFVSQDLMQPDARPPKEAASNRRKSQGHHRDLELRTSSQIPGNGAHAPTDAPPDHPGSFSSQGGGSTPKRPRPRPSFKIPTMRSRDSGITSTPGIKATSPHKRAALKNVSSNRRYASVGFAITSDGKRHENNAEWAPRSVRKARMSLPNINTADFDMDEDELLTGTPLTPGQFLAGTGQVPQTEDESTTEL